MHHIKAYFNYYSNSIRITWIYCSLLRIEATDDTKGVDEHRILHQPTPHQNKTHKEFSAKLLLPLINPFFSTVSSCLLQEPSWWRLTSLAFVYFNDHACTCHIIHKPLICPIYYAQHVLITCTLCELFGLYSHFHHADSSVYAFCI